MNERDIKYKAFVKDDTENNRGLIVNNYQEIASIMKEPSAYIAFINNYLTNMLTFVTRHSDFYRKYENYKSLNDFPVVNKNILKENWERVFVKEFSDRKDNKERRTSGSTGTPFQVCWDRRKHCRMIADIKWFAHLAEIESHERIVCLITDDKGERSSIEKMQKDNVYNIYCSYADDLNIESVFKQFLEYSPKMIISWTPMWDAIANYIADGKGKSCAFNVKAIISEGQVLTDRTRKIISEYFGCRVYSRYGSQECGPFAQEDGSGYGHLINTSSYIIEILDLYKDEPAKQDDIGRIVITDLFNYAFPIIRYDIGDLARKKRTQDGREYLSEILGRKADTLYSTDGKIVCYSQAIFFLKKYRDIRQMQVVQESRYDYTWILNTNNCSYEEIIKKEATEIFGVDSHHSVRYVSEIPKLRSGKTQVTICKIDPSKEFGHLK